MPDLKWATSAVLGVLVLWLLVEMAFDWRENGRARRVWQEWQERRKAKQE